MHRGLVCCALTAAGCVALVSHVSWAAPDVVVADRAQARWLVRASGAPLFVVGPGDPEDFLYRGERAADGTRRGGDQESIIARIARSDANGIYFQMIRSHGGDGAGDHNPFVDADATRGLDEDVLAQWDGWLAALDGAGIVTLLFFYDDGARIWDTGDAVGADEERFVRALVDRFERYGGIVWCLAEEYGERYTAARMRRLAAIVRDADDHDHAIAVHLNHGTSLGELADDANIDQFAMQYNAAGGRELHDGVVEAWRVARGRYNINMSESQAHRLALERGDRTQMRRLNWAAAMGGAWVMQLGPFASGGAMTDEMLADMGRQRRFFESIDLRALAPHDAAAADAGAFVLADPGRAWLVWNAEAGETLGLRGIAAGRYDLMWHVGASGQSARETARGVTAGDVVRFARPAGIGPEVALYLRRAGGGGNVAPVAEDQDVRVPANEAVAIALAWRDADGPGPHRIAIVEAPRQGTLSGDGAARRYTPVADFVGRDAFTFTVNDGIDTSTPATVRIVVDVAGNQAPLVADRIVRAHAGAPVSLHLVWDDVDGPGPYGVRIVEGPRRGTLTGEGNDRVYTAARELRGRDAFVWQVSDGELWSRPAVVTLLAGVEVGLVGHWKFDEREGDVARDASGLGHDGRLRGAVRTGGRSGHGVSLDGADDLVEVADAPGLRVGGEMSAAAWVRVAEPRRDAYVRVASKKGAWDDAIGWELVLHPRGGRVLFIGAGAPQARSAVIAFDTAWHHVAVTAREGRAQLYVDGVDRTEQGAVGAVAPSTVPLRLGGAFGGVLDDVRVYARALVADEVAALAAGREVTANEVPIARAEAPARAVVGGGVVLDGRTSWDPDRGPAPLAYTWTQVDGPATAALADAGGVRATATPAAVGRYTFRLVVGDGEATALDEVVVEMTGGGP
jgi:hypothetical protein